MKNTVWAAFAFSAMTLILASCEAPSDADGAQDAATAAPALTVDIPFEKFTLDNGLTVIVHEDRKAPIVAISIWYHVGSKDEPEGKSGFAHLFEHLMFNGSENHDDEYFGPMRDVGVTGINGTTWFDRTNYFETVPTPALDMALWLESDRMGHLLGAVTQEKLDEQRGVVQNEKRSGDNQPYGKAEYRQLEGLFPEGHPYRHSTIGSMEDLDAATLEDVHAWFKQYYGAANTVLVLAGDIDAATAKEKVTKYFGDIDAGPPLYQMKSYVPDATANKSEVMYDRVPQTRLMRAWAVPGRTTKAYADLQLAAAILGRGKNSRLYKKLVHETQLAVSTYAYAQPFELTSWFEIGATLKDTADEARVRAIFDALLADFLENGPTAAEVSRARTTLISNRIKGLEQIGGFGGKAAILATGELYAGDAGFYKTRLNWLNAATPTSVRDAARASIANGYHELAARPFGSYQSAETGAERDALPAVGAMPEFSFPLLAETTLSNGIRVVVAERHTVPVVNLAIQFDAGYAADFGAPLGVGNFTLAMMDEGTASRSAMEISEALENLGATLNTTSSLDASEVHLTAMAANLDASLAIYADVIRNPAFTEDEIERLRPRLLAGIAQEKSRPVTIGYRELPKLLYGDGHAYGVPLTGSGTEAGVSAITRDDLRQFHATWIRADAATIFIVGDTTLDAITPALEAAFGDWQPSDTAKGTKTITEVAAPDAARVVLIDKPGAEQSVILAAQLVPSSSDAGNFDFDVANDILGGSFLSRLNMNLREDKGWSYGVRSQRFSARGQRLWFTSAPVQTDKTGAAIAELKREYAEYVSDRPATEEERIGTLKQRTNSLPGQYETSDAVLGSLAFSNRLGRPLDYDGGTKARYDALTLEAVHAAATKEFRFDRLVWLIIGDVDKITDEVRAELGEVEVIAAGAGGD